MAEQIEFCICGNRAKYLVDGIPKCGRCLHAYMGALKIDFRVLVPGKCKIDQSCGYWCNGECVVFKCVKE